MIPLKAEVESRSPYETLKRYTRNDAFYQLRNLPERTVKKIVAFLVWLENKYQDLGKPKMFIVRDMRLQIPDKIFCITFPKGNPKELKNITLTIKKKIQDLGLNNIMRKITVFLNYDLILG